MNRLILILLLVFPVGPWLRSLEAADSPRPNVLFIAVDDLKPLLGCYGNTMVKTPNLDRLAARGVLFERAYCQVAVCGPTRASVLSGLRPDSTKVFENSTSLRSTRPDVVLLPGHFRLNGYQTVALGKVHHYDSDGTGSWSEPIWRPYAMGPSTREYLLPENVARVRQLAANQPKNRKNPQPVESVKGPAWEAIDLLNDVYPDGLTADAAVQTILRLKQSPQPFFLAVGFIKPHLPFACPQKYWDLYDPTAIPLPNHNTPPYKMPPVAYADSNELRQYDGIPGPGQPIPIDLSRKLLHGYYACTSYVDAEIGRVLAALDQAGLTQNTIIVLWGDHGWHLGENGIWGKSTNFEQATHVPMIIAAPEAKGSGRKSHRLVEHVDIYPTLVELCGLPPALHTQGQSLVPLLENPDALGKPAAFSQFLREGNVMGYSMRTERWRYTEWIKDGDTRVGTELYDHAVDPDETRNLADDALLRPAVTQLADDLDASRKRWNGVVKADTDDEVGFESLFNGVDLTEWDGMPGAWRVKDGAIICGGTEKNWLIWRGGEVADFELRLRFRFTKGNSGVQVRSQDKGHWQLHGYQVEVASRDKMGLWHESLWSEKERALLATAGQKVYIASNGDRTVEQVADPAHIQRAFRENDWNDLIIVADGSRLVQIINGVIFAEVTDEDAHRSRRAGRIGLQDHGKDCVAEFKDIRLRRKSLQK